MSNDMFYIPTEADMAEASKKLEPDYMKAVAEKLDGISTALTSIEMPQPQIQYAPQDTNREQPQQPEYRGIAVQTDESGLPYISADHLKTINSTMYGDDIETLKREQAELKATLAHKEELETFSWVKNKVTEDLVGRGYNQYQATTLSDMALAQYGYNNFMPNVQDPKQRIDAAINFVSGVSQPIQQDVLPITNGTNSYSGPSGYQQAADPQYAVRPNETVVVRAPGPGKDREEFVRINNEISELYNRFEREGKPVPNIVYSDANLYTTKDPNEIQMYLESQHGKGVRYLTNPLKQLGNLH